VIYSWTRPRHKLNNDGTATTTTTANAAGVDVAVLTFYWQFSFKTFQNLIAPTSKYKTTTEDNDNGEVPHVIDDDGAEDEEAIKRVDDYDDQVTEGSGDAEPEDSVAAT